MKKTITLAIAILNCCLAINAQDIITLRNGDEIQAKVSKISDTEIEYKQWNNQAGPTYAKSISDIFMIKFENGEKTVFNLQQTNTQNTKLNSTAVYGEEPMYRKGRDIYIGSRKLYQSDVISLFGANRANSYSSSRNEILWGTVLIPTGAAMTIAGGVLAIVGEFDELIGLWVPLLSTGVVSAVVGGILMGDGFSTINELVDEYNSVNPKSLSFYPTLMRTPTSDLATGIGLTLKF